MYYVTNGTHCLVNEISIMASESNEVEVIKENDAWVDLDVDEISSNDHVNEVCIVRIRFIQTMKILLLLDQRTVIIMFLLTVLNLWYLLYLLTMKMHRMTD
jgi:hypothetical protein